MEGACCPVCRLKEVCVDVDAVRTTKVGGLIPNTKLGTIQAVCVAFHLFMLLVCLLKC